MFCKEIFAKRLKTLRLLRKLRQEDVASVLKVSRVQISDIENAKTLTSLDRVYKLADLFNVSLDYLFGRCDNPSCEDACPPIQVNKALTEGEKLVLRHYRNLTDEGKDYIIDQTFMALNMYKKPKPPSVADTELSQEVG